MSFARRVLLELTDNLTIGIITHVPTAIIQIANRRGTVNAVHQGTSQFMYKLNLRSTLSSKQIQSFNDLNYRLADLIDFSRNPLRRLAHFISISIKEKLNSAYKFATIDSCGKVYAYTGMPAYFHETRKWGGMGRRFLCRLEHNEYRGLHQTVFKINGWMIAPYDPSKREYAGVPMVEKMVNTPTIHEHIQNRIKYLEDKADEISKIQSQILSLQNDVEEIQKDMANVNIEKKIDKAKNLLANNADVNEYPTGVYLIEPTEELIEILVEIGQLVHMNDSSSRRGTHKDALFVAGVEAVFRNRERTDGNSKYIYKVHLRNSSTYYFSLTPEKVKA